MRVEPGLPLILDFAAAALASPAQVGGKGHHLGRLSRYGFAVPNGIVLSTEAHHLACRAIENAEQLHQLARSVGTDESVLRRVRERIEETPLPIELTQALEQTMLAHSWLDTPLAVRSSAALEDSATASFAGMHLSVLKVVGISDVTQAIKAVWASV